MEAASVSTANPGARRFCETYAMARSAQQSSKRLEGCAAEGDDCIGSVHGPEPSRALQAADHCEPARCNHSRADEEILAAELGVAHAVGMALEIGCLDAPLVELLLAPAHTVAALFLVQWEQVPTQFPEMLAGVVDVDDLDGVGGSDAAQIPNPCRAVSDHDLALGAVQAALPGLVVDALPERRGVLLLAPVYVVKLSSRTGRPSASRSVCVKTQRSLTSRGRAVASCLPWRPADATALNGIPVPSISM